MGSRFNYPLGGVMKLKIADKNAKWWKGEKGITWAVKQGKDWWLFRPKEESKELKNVNNCAFPLANKNRFTDMVDKFYFFVKCAWAGLLGVSLAFNIVLYIQVKELQNNISNHESQFIKQKK